MRHIEYVHDDSYIRPETASDLMKAAAGVRRTVYIYGATGYGKTSFAVDFLGSKAYDYYDMATGPFPDADPETQYPPIVVIDDLQALDTAEKRGQLYPLLERLSRDPSVWLILISRTPLPAWLKPLSIRRIFLTIGESELSLTEEEESRYFDQWELSLMPGTARLIHDLCSGYPLALRIAALNIRNLPETGKTNEERAKEEKEAVERAGQDLLDYMKTEVYDELPPDLQGFLMDMSIVDRFDLEMAVQITRENDACKYIRMAMETGNFLAEYPTSETVVYEIRRPVRRAAKKELISRYPQDYVYDLYDRAGAAYELGGHVENALLMYEKCGDHEGISRLLIANARKHAGVGHYWELRRYYYTLPEDVISRNADLMAGMSLLQSIAMNDSESERWYHRLEAYSKEQTGAMKREAEARLFYLDIVLPQRGTAGIIDILKRAWTFARDRKTVIPQMSLTNNQPSLMHGGKDFCEWSKHDRQLALSIGKPVEQLLGEFGKGLTELAMAESLFEKTEDPGDVEIRIHKGWLEALSGGRPEMVFVAVGLLARLSLSENRLSDAVDGLQSLEKGDLSVSPHLSHGIDACLAELVMYFGDSETVDRWMKTAPDENTEFCSLERFIYVVKAKGYLSRGENEKAKSLLQTLILYASQRSRTYLEIQAHVLYAVVLHRLKDNNN